MGNTKVYTFRCPLFPGEKLVTRQELADAARSSLVIVEMATDGHETVVMGMAESCSLSADGIMELVRARYPKRWCVITRFDADWSDFRVFSWNSPRDELPEVQIADNWHEPGN